MEKKETRSEQIRVIGDKEHETLRRAMLQVLGLLAPDCFENVVILLSRRPEKVNEAVEMLKQDPKLKLILLGIGPNGKDEWRREGFGELLDSDRAAYGDSLKLPLIIMTASNWKKQDEALAAGGEPGAESDDAPRTEGKPRGPGEEAREFIDNCDQMGLLQVSLVVKEKIMSVLRHDLKDYVIREKGDRYREIIATARKVFAIKSEATDEQVEQFVVNSAMRPREVMKGEIAGVYCDLDDTLMMKDGSINEETLARLEAYAAQGKEVFIWTGGGLDAAAAKLKGTLLEKFKLVSKYDFCGATAEVVIDNVSREKFYFQYRIKVKRYVRV